VPDPFRGRMKHGAVCYNVVMPSKDKYARIKADPVAYAAKLEADNILRRKRRIEHPESFSNEITKARRKKYDAEHREQRNACARRYRLAHPEKEREKKRKYKLKNADKIREYERIRQRNDGGGYGKRWRTKINPESAVSAGLYRDYGITLKEYNAILERQRGVCAICSRPPLKRRLHVDHDHSCCPSRRCCGKCIRGLLCWYCNQSLGMLQDSVEVLENAENYIQTYLQSRGVDGYSRVAQSEIKDFSRDARIRRREIEIRQRQEQESERQETSISYCTFGGSEGFALLAP
jgi:hypothetical protein